MLCHDVSTFFSQPTKLAFFSQHTKFTTLQYTTAIKYYSNLIYSFIMFHPTSPPQVRFHETVLVTTISTHRYYTDEERTSVWYTSDDYRRFQHQRKSSQKSSSRSQQSLSQSRRQQRSSCLDHRWGGVNSGRTSTISRDVFPTKPMRH